MDVSAVIADFGAFYTENGQNMNDLKRALEKPGEFLGSFPVLRTMEQRKRKAKDSLTGDVLQPFQKGWTPRGTAKSDPLFIDQFKAKVDIELFPDDIEESWRGFREQLSSDEDRAKWPLVRYIWEYLVQRRLARNKDECAYKGVRVEPTAGTPGPALAAFNGARYIINKLVDDGDVTTISTGVLSTTPATFVTQIEDFHKQIPQDYRDEEMVIEMNIALAERFREGMDAKYNTNYLRTQDTMRLRYWPNIEVRGYKAMNGSDKIICTPPSNKQRLTHPLHATENPMFNHEKFRKVIGTTTLYEGVGYWLPEEIFTNDRDLV
jgi:hypothetical protein